MTGWILAAALAAITVCMVAGAADWPWSLIWIPYAIAGAAAAIIIRLGDGR